MKKFIVAALLLVSNASFAISFSSAQQVYQKLLAANHLEALPLILVSDSEINAETDGLDIYVYSGLLRNIKNQDEIALVLGHEMAHNTLHNSGSSPPRELAADKLGAQYAASAGYNVCKGAQLFKKFNSAPSRTHPGSKERIQKLGCKL